MITEPVNLILAASILFIALLFVALGIPLMKRKVKMNNVYGIRFKKSYESEAAWYDINVYGGRVLTYCAIPLALLGIMSLYIDFDSSPTVALVVALSPALVVIVGGGLAWKYAKEYSDDE